MLCILESNSLVQEPMPVTAGRAHNPTLGTYGRAESKRQPCRALRYGLLMLATKTEYDSESGKAIQKSSIVMRTSDAGA